MRNVASNELPSLDTSLIGAPWSCSIGNGRIECQMLLSVIILFGLLLLAGAEPKDQRWTPKQKKHSEGSWSRGRMENGDANADNSGNNHTEHSSVNGGV